MLYFSFLQNEYPGMFTFDEALKLINIERIGNLHSAIDNAKSLAKMVTHLYHYGAKLVQVTDWIF